jgi:superfamily I DNA/RNA helicase
MASLLGIWMFKEILQAILRFFGVADEPHEVTKTPSSLPVRQPVPQPVQAPPPVAPQPAVPPSPSPPPPPPPKKRYEGKGFTIKTTHIEEAKEFLYRRTEGSRKGPTPEQAQVIFSDLAATSVLAGAGSGKSTTLVGRVLFLHKCLGVSFGNMSVFTFTKKSRADFITKLVKEAKHWDVKLSEKKAESIVRTFHSKALQLYRGVLGPDQEIFEFLGKEKPVPAEVRENGLAGAAEDRELSEDEEAANEIEGFADMPEGRHQSEILKDVYSKCFNTDTQFRKHIAELFEFTVCTPQVDDAEKLSEKSQHLSKMSWRDPAFCSHLERKWEAQGNWPIAGIETCTEGGERYALDVMGTKLFANGYIKSLDIYVVLGKYDGINNDQVADGKVKFKPKYAAEDKRFVLLAACDKKIRYLNKKEDALRLVRELELNSLKGGLSAPAVEIRMPGEFSSKPVFSSLYAFGAFAENLGRQPQTLATDLAQAPLARIEHVALAVVSKFFEEFYNELERQHLITFNQMFSRLSAGNKALKALDVSALVGAKHLMIDEFQDISPLIVNFVEGIHGELLRKSGGKIQPTLMCVGDDWQSIYGWRGSAPHFFLKFYHYFEGAPKKSVLLQDNFRSSQHIIDCGEAFIEPVISKSSKRGIAKTDAVKALPFKVAEIDDFKTLDVHDAIRRLLSKMGPDEELYLLAATHDELKPFKGKYVDERFMCTTFHQSKGLEAEYVILLGAPRYFGPNSLKSALYKLAKFPQGFDQAQQDEALRIAYVAATRAKRLCMWFTKAEFGNVITQVPAGSRRVELSVSEGLEYIDSCLAMFSSREAA